MNMNSFLKAFFVLTEKQLICCLLFFMEVMTITLIWECENCVTCTIQDVWRHRKAPTVSTYSVAHYLCMGTA